MNIIKCKNNHFFDAEKFLSCPHCANALSDVRTENLPVENQHNVSTAIPLSTTIPEPLQLRKKTVGWLVCVMGAMLGESFVLREGKNYIGRAANMDVALLYEPTVSRKIHAVIAYDPVRHSCILYAQENAPQTFCNERTVKTKKILRSRDIIRLGTCSLVFIPFCNASFSWSYETE